MTAVLIPELWCDNDCATPPLRLDACTTIAELRRWAVEHDWTTTWRSDDGTTLPVLVDLCPRCSFPYIPRANDHYFVDIPYGTGVFTVPRRPIVEADSP